MTLPPRLRRRLLVGGALLALYAVLGFLVAPPLLRGKLVRELHGALHREVSIRQVRLNPFALSATVRGLSVKDRDGAQLAGGEEIYLRVRPWSFFSKDVGLSEVRLTRPALRLALDHDGNPTFQDLLSPAAPPASPGQDPKKKDQAGSGWGLYVGLLTIEDARLSFVDGSFTPAFEKTLGPWSFRLERFHTRPDQGSPYRFAGSTDAGERFSWDGEITADPPGSAGELRLEKIRLDGYRPYTSEQAPAEVRSGLATLSGKYRVEWGSERKAARVTEARLLLEALRLGRPGVAEDDVTLPSVEISGTALDLLAPSAAIGKVAVRGGRIRAQRAADGTLNLSVLAVRPATAPAPSPATATADSPAPAPAASPAASAAPPAPTPAGARALTWSVGEVAVEGVRVEWEDRVPARPVTVALDPLAVKLEDLRSDPSSSWALTASAGWGGGGRIALGGAVSPLESRGELTVDVAGLELAPVAPYVDTPVARLTGGKLGVKGKARFDGRPGRPPGGQAGFSGDLRVEGLTALDPAVGEELLRMRTLEVSGIEAAVEPVKARVRTVRLVEPRLRVIKAGPAAAAPAAEQGVEKPPASLAIGTLLIQRGRLDFADRTVQPAVAVDLSEVEVKVTGLSTDPRTRSGVDARLKVVGSPLSVTGTLNPLQSGAYTDLKILSRAIDLTPLSPYAGKHVGYTLNKGKLDVDVRVKIEERQLDGENVLVVDQLTLGDKTDSPDATSLPVKLALAVLQDRDGVIHVDVPVEGDLDDPDFQVGGLVWSALLNVLTKLITSPFSALAALAGAGSEDLSAIEFPPGSSESGEAGQKRLALLAKALSDRPRLGLEIEGTVDGKEDLLALQRRAWEEKKAKGEARGAEGKAATPPTPEEEQKLIAALPIPPEALAALAAERAERSRQAFLDADVDGSRIFLVRGGEKAAAGGARAWFTLR